MFASAAQKNSVADAQQTLPRASRRPASAPVSMALACALSGLIGGASGAGAVWFAAPQLFPPPAPAASLAPPLPAPAPALTPAPPTAEALAAEITALSDKLARIEAGLLQLGPEAPPETAALAKRITALEAAPPTDPARYGRAAAALSARVETLEAARGETLTLAAGLTPLRLRVADLEAAAKTLAPASDVDALRGEIAAVRAGLEAGMAEASAAGRAARAAFAVAAAVEAARASGPFVEAHAALAAALPDEPNVAALAPLARLGAPSRAALLEDFPAIEAAIDRALRAEASGGGLMGKMQAALAQQVSVRPVDDAGSPRSKLDLARQAIAREDVAGAVAALEQLTGPPREAARAWLDPARRRLEIDARLAAVRADLSKG